MDKQIGLELMCEIEISRTWKLQKKRDSFPALNVCRYKEGVYTDHMDNHSVKRSLDGVVVPRRSSGIVLRSETQDREQFCNRLGCKGRLNHTKLSQSGCSGKNKSSRSLPLNVSNGMDVVGTSSNGMDVVGSSSGTRSVGGGKTRKSVERSHASSRYFQSETDSSEATSSSIHEDEKHVPEDGKVGIVELGSSSVSLPKNSSNQKKVPEKKSGLGTRSILLGSSNSIASKSSINNQGTRKNAANTSRYGLRNLRCNSISDVLPSGSSSVNSKHSKRKDLVKKTDTDVESSSSNRGKKMSGPFSEDNRGYSTSKHGIHISDSRRGGSIQTRSVSNNTQTRRSQNSERRMFPSGNPRSESSIVMDPFTPNRFPTEASSSNRSTPFTRPGSSGYSLGDGLAAGPRGLGFPNPLLNMEGFRRHNVDAIAEALLALERIEQDEELTYEQLMALDANLFLGGLGFFDQHREMRLDIDNMSYEELLALEEKMGSVSTALPEEAISKSLKSSIFQPKALGEGNIIGSKGDHNEVKCSICQEEYKVEDEVGRLKCDHGYHMECIHQWLRLKNWCPICKTPAAAAPSPPA